LLLQLKTCFYKEKLMKQVIVTEGIPGADQQGSFINATLQAVGLNLDMSVATRVEVPPGVIEKGEGVVAAFVHTLLLKATAAAGSALHFEVQLGSSSPDAVPRESTAEPRYFEASTC
jgi:hypothetical protein